MPRSREKTKLRTRFEADQDRLIRDIEAWGYPCPWTADALRADCICFRIEDDSGPIAYAWAHWTDAVPDEPQTLDFHACAGPFGRGRWITPGVLATTFACAELMGATCLITRPNGPDASRIRRLLIRLGFQDQGGHLFRRLEP